MESNKLTRRALLGAISGSLVLAGCVGGDDDDDEPASEDGSNGDDSSDEGGTDNGDDVTVQLRTHEEHGDILVGPDQLTLYMFDADEQGAGTSACTGGCAESWPPLTVEELPVAGDGVDADLTTIERENGSQQVAANGWPLYYWANDEAPGDTDGQGVNDVWWVLDASGTPIRGGDSDDGSQNSGGSSGGYP